MHSSRQQNIPVTPDSTTGTFSSVTAEIGKAPIRGRRSERVRFEMAVGIYRHRENEEPILEEGKTLNVNAHGALLAITTPAAIGEVLWLINPRTRQEIECRVCRVGIQYPGGVEQISIEFLEVSPTFWDVDSRPSIGTPPGCLLPSACARKFGGPQFFQVSPFKKHLECVS
jgi:hypothetical protein